MALRAFRCNPALGGFGNETGLLHETRENVTTGKSQKQKRRTGNSNCSGDAFAQILKELVDNAVDACGYICDTDREESTIKRVRVNIEKVETSIADDANEDRELLRVEVNDNGCGMDDIEKRVSVFNSSKGVNELGGKDPQGIETAGRYGIGLTLCLLHAQRLVPNSCAVITSTVRGSSSITRAKFVVDMDRDSVICVEKSNIEKENVEGSGTSISLLLPGGIGASEAWPRLAEYFARFQLSLGLKCSLEVMAPSLSRLPLFIRPPTEELKKTQDKENCFIPKFSSPPKVIQQPREEEPGNGTTDEETKGSKDFYDFLDNHQCTPDNKEMQNSGLVESNHTKNIDKNDLDTEDNGCILELEDVFISPSKSPDRRRGPAVRRIEISARKLQEDVNLERRIQMQNSVGAYLKKPIELANVAHSSQKIRRSDVIDTKMADSAPTLDVDIIISAFDEEEKAFYSEEGNDRAIPNDGCSEIDRSKAKIMLIRMVNRIPMLDSAEASACGIVRGLQHKSLWNSFGLEIAIVQSLSGTGEGNKSMFEALHVPTFSLGDSAHVAPFFTMNNTHTLLSDDESSHSEDDDHSFPGHEQSTAATRKRKRNRKMSLKPAGLRLGNFLIIVQLNAKSLELPLPTLSKGRLPMNDDSINAALQAGLNSCLRSLQKTNPSLLLTPSQLKKTEREVIYIPTLASALSSLTCNCNNIALREKSLANVGFADNENEDDNPSKQIQDDLTEHLESLIRHSLLIYEKDRKNDAKEKQRTARQTKVVTQSQDAERDKISSDNDDDSVSMSSSQHDLENFINNQQAMGPDESVDTEEISSVSGDKCFVMKNGNFEYEDDDLKSTFSTQSSLSKESSIEMEDCNSFKSHSSDDDFDVFLD